MTVVSSILLEPSKTLYKIRVENPSSVCHGVREARLDDELLSSNEIPLGDDGQTHQVLIVLGETRNV